MCEKSIDLVYNLQYNRDMTKVSRKIICLRIILTLACIGVLVFIFSNSWASASASSASSSAVTDAVQSVVKVFAPNSFIATAVGDDYKKLMSWVRTCAHFAEFALMGALFIWCYFSYTKRRRTLYIPLLGILCVPFIDECIQLFSDGRAWEIADVLVDILGGISGAGFAVLVVGLLFWRGAVRKKRREEQ